MSRLGYKQGLQWAICIKNNHISNDPCHASVGQRPVGMVSTLLLTSKHNFQSTLWIGFLNNIKRNTEMVVDVWQSTVIITNADLDLKMSFERTQEYIMNVSIKTTVPNWIKMASWHIIWTSYFMFFLCFKCVLEAVYTLIDLLPIAPSACSARNALIT